MKDKIAITVEKDIIESIDKLIKNWLGKNRSQVIEQFLKKQIYDEDSIHAFIIANDIKWDNWDYNFDIPKQLLKINKKSVIFHQVRLMSLWWINRITIIIPEWKIDLFKKDLEWFFPHIKIDFVEVAPEAKTWTAIKAWMKKLLEAKYILITNWDTYIPDLNLLDFIKYHKNNNSNWTFILKYIRTNLHKFWNVTIQWNLVSEYIEKPKSTNMFKYLTNCGWYLVTKEFWDSISYDWEWLETDLFPFLPSYWNIFAYIYPNAWWHIQSMWEYEMAYN